MTTIQGIGRNLRGQKEMEVVLETAVPTPPPVTQITNLNLDIAPHDPLLAYVQNNTSVLAVDRLHLASSALQALRDAGLQLVVPLVS